MRSYREVREAPLDTISDLLRSVRSFMSKTPIERKAALALPRRAYQSNGQMLMAKVLWNRKFCTQSQRACEIRPQNKWNTEGQAEPRTNDMIKKNCVESKHVKYFQQSMWNPSTLIKFSSIPSPLILIFTVLVLLIYCLGRWFKYLHLLLYSCQFVLWCSRL